MRQRHIFWFWLPLFASWLLMTAEGPIVTAAINRLPDEVIMLAAMGIVVSLSVAIESPIMNLLSTATALVNDRHSYTMVRRYTIHWSIALTVLSALFAFTPLFDLVVVRWMATPLNVAAWVRPGMQIMLLWTAAIAWRRFLQGVLIYFDYTRYVAWGAVLRLVASGGATIALAFWSDFPGVIIGSIALMAGVLAEAFYATWASRRLFGHELMEVTAEVAQGGADGPAPPLTYRELNRFHLPLAATSVLTLLAQPMVTFSLARLDNPTRSLAAWPLTFQLALMARAGAMALPEVVIALTKGPSSHAPVRRFAFSLTLLSAIAMLIFVVSPALPFYLLRLQDTEPAVAALAAQGTRLFLFFPPLFTLVMWLRGVLIKQRATTAVNLGMFLNLVVTALILFLGMVWRQPGIVVAAASLNAALAVELIYLLWRTRQVSGGLELNFLRAWTVATASVRRRSSRP